ncbi:MAG: pre-peptidase C-terminal domain-containing protein, partial [Myxococcota bacterium]
QDGDCTRTNPKVLFDVRPIDSFGQYLARAFFPNASRTARNILVDGSTFDVSEPLTLTGILRHELGHVLGFRHEHTRPEAGTCFEDNNWRDLTPYDSNSVMHYPQCNGTGDFSLEITGLDAQGVVALYGSGEPPPPPGGIELDEQFQGGVARGEEDRFGPFNVVEGTTFSAIMSDGSGDPDLYVRFDAEPSTGSYACRPYRVGASEECILTVPDGASTAFVMIRGFSQGTYRLDVNYTTPDVAPPPPIPGGEVTEVFEGSILQRDIDRFQPLNVIPGTDFTVNMSGTGDPDLYVRFGGDPTTATYDCRPYRNGATESCELLVPDGVDQAYFMVRGYRDGTYRVEVTYAVP